MICLRSGHCCRNIPPPEVEVNEDGACVHLREADGIASCAIYDRRPNACAAHDFPAEICPVGASTLKNETMHERLTRLGYRRTP